VDEVAQGADRVAQAEGSASDLLAMLGDGLIDVITRHPDHVWIFLHEYPALAAERAEQFRLRRDEFEQRVVKVLRAGVDSGEFRHVDPALTARAWLGLHSCTYLWLTSSGELSADQVAGTFADTFIHPSTSSPRPRRRRRSAPYGAE
jgi:AcrR family transcriptional regulator